MQQYNITENIGTSKKIRTGREGVVQDVNQGITWKS